MRGLKEEIRLECYSVNLTEPLRELLKRTKKHPRREQVKGGGTVRIITVNSYIPLKLGPFDLYHPMQHNDRLSSKDMD